METVLIVEPHRAAREALAKLFSDEGFGVVALERPDEAIAFARERSVDILLIDVSFQAARSDEAAAAILSLHPSLLVIFMACNAWSSSRIAAPIVLKPIEVGELLATMRAAR